MGKARAQQQKKVELSAGGWAGSPTPEFTLKKKYQKQQHGLKPLEYA